MTHTRTNIKLDECSSQLDRVQFVAWPSGEKVPPIPGFCCERDSFVGCQTAIVTYRRVRTLRNPQSKTKLYLQYGRACPWLAPVKGTVVGDDATGLCRQELDDILSQFGESHLLLVEFAIDFPASLNVTDEFVLGFAVFGKSRQLVALRWPKQLRYGTRKSAKLVRCYEKATVDAYRVELELHSAWLRQHKIAKPSDLQRLPGLLIPAHIRFVQIDLRTLAGYLIRHHKPVKRILSEVELLSGSLQNVLTLLRIEVGLSNVHRFLRPLEINEEISRALEVWSRNWRRAVSERCSEKIHD